MPERTGRFAWVIRAALFATVLALVVVGLALAGTLALLIVYAIDPSFLVRSGLLPQAKDWPAWMVVLPVILAVGLELVAAFWLLALYGLARTVVANEHGVAQMSGRLERLETLLARQGQAFAELNHLGTLSDQAKSLIYRETEIEAIRETVHGDLMRQDYATAERLIDDVEKRLGYADEAERLRQEVAAARQATVEEKIDAAVQRVETILDRQDWARARREAERLTRLFPDHPKVTALPQRVQQARTAHKRHLLQQYSEAVRTNDTDRGVALLHELDTYLTPQEGAALQESARGVFRAHLRQLGVQFSLCVTDHRWAQAIEVGQTIVKEFPNTRMAMEVREKLPMLRSRASGETPHGEAQE